MKRKIEKIDGRFVIAEGEATGHCHSTESDIDLYEEDGNLSIIAPEGIVLDHNEHEIINYPATEMLVDFVQELSFHDIKLQRPRRVYD